jgi:signal transduction histidine kinase
MGDNEPHFKRFKSFWFCDRYFRKERSRKERKTIKRKRVVNALFSNVLSIDGEKKEKHFQEALKITKEKAEESAREKSLFLANISHDIKNPLNAISGFSSLLNDLTISAEQRKEYHLQIIQNTELLSSLIKNILDLSKIEASRIRIEVNNCKLNELLDDTFRATESKRGMYARDKVIVELDKGNPDSEFTVH